MCVNCTKALVEIVKVNNLVAISYICRRQRAHIYFFEKVSRNLLFDKIDKVFIVSSIACIGG